MQLEDKHLIIADESQLYKKTHWTAVKVLNEQILTHRKDFSESLFIGCAHKLNL